MILARLRRFGRDTDGQLSIEAALMIPLIVWIYVATFTYFETFRADATNVKAAYTLGDILSRETVGVNQTYVNGLNQAFRAFTLARQPTWVRVSLVSWDVEDDELQLRWSAASEGHQGLTSLDPVRQAVPMMAPGDSVIVVETYMRYVPEFNIGLDPFTYRNVVVTRPRFAPKLDWLS